MGLDLGRFIGQQRGQPNQNWVALALREIESYVNQIPTAIPPASGPVIAPTIHGGSAVPSETPFQLQVNGVVSPNNNANFNNALPPPVTASATVKWQIDTTLPVPNISGSYVTPNSFNAVPFSTTPVFDASKGNVQEITLTGNVTSFTITNPTAGQTITLMWLQDASGGHTVTGAPLNLRGFTTPGTTLSTYSVQAFSYDGANWVAVTAGIINI